MRPKLSADTYYIPFHDGIYLRSNSRCFILKGKSLYRLLEHLTPYLDGNTTLEALTEGLEIEQKRMITNLVEKLLTHHFLQDISLDQPSTLHLTEQETYASNITFISSFQSSPAYQFERFRNRRLLLIGSGYGLTSLIQASLQCGVRQIDGMITPDDDSDIHSNTTPLDAFSTCDAEQTVRLIDAPRWDDEGKLSSIIQGYDAILHIAEQPVLARARLLNKLCTEQQKTCIQAIMLDGHAWIGPLVAPESQGCWECAWRRLQSQLTHHAVDPSRYQFHDQSNTTSLSLTEPTATIAANRLIFELFKYATHIKRTEATEFLLDIDLETSLSTSHMFLPHPLCQTCQHPAIPTEAQFLAGIQQLQHQEPIDPDAFFKNMTNCTDARVGLFATAGDDDFTQAPLMVYRVQLPDMLMLHNHQHGSSSVLATGISTRDARLHASQRACERYASTLVDPRRLHSRENIQHDNTPPVISTDQLIGPEPAYTKNEQWTWALDLHTQKTCLVPASYVFTTRPLSYHERGVASGMSWEEAVCLALLDWCNYLTIEQLNATNRTYTQVDLARTPMTSVSTHLRHLLQIANEPITIYDVTGPLHVPTFATCNAEKVIAYTTHFDTTQALTMGLEQALQHYQAEQNQQPEYAIAPVADLPAFLRSDQAYMPHYTLPLPETWSARLEWLQEKLQAHHVHTLVVPLNHDPALTQILPSIVRVLLTRAEVKHEA